ncbi:hypothetical protein PHYNN_79 [Pantoea phage Phynn]|nr:hypothetical protein PHYNN_79 [Pantoea phage Phynn]
MSLDLIMQAGKPLIEEMTHRHRIKFPFSGCGNFNLSKGRKYVRIMRGYTGSISEGFIVAGFIDKDGNILFGAHDRPYKWDSAKRGNIFDPDKGFGALCDGGLLRYL